MTTRKVTKKAQYNTILAILADAEANNVELPEGITYDGLNEFVSHEIELLDNKAAAAAKRAADKKTEGDELRGKVLSVLTGEYQTIPEIVAAVTAAGVADATPQKITSRLTQLANLGQATKDSISVPTADGKTRKVSAYKVAD